MRTRVFGLILGLALGLCGAAWGQAIPPNTLLNHDGTEFLHNEEQIWISLTDSLYVMADWRDWRLGYRRVGFTVSSDAGVTWGIDTLVVGRYAQQSDPCMTGDGQGNFFMNLLDYNPGGESQISVFRSADNGQSWTGPVATGPLGPYFEDKQFTTTDRTGGAHDGNYYISWTRFPNTGPAVIMFVRSTNGAQTFFGPIVVGPVIFSNCGTYGAGQGSIPVVNSDGSVHVFWSGYDIDSSCSVPLSRSYAIRHAVSTNGGLAFGSDEAAFPSNAYFQMIDGGVDVYGFPMADADISGGPYDGTIYIAHTQYVSGFSGETDIQLRKSTDNGASWSDPVVVNDDEPGQNIDQFHPWLAVNQDGVIAMIFYDQRTDPDNHYLFDCFFTASFDGGETFIRNYRISEVSINPGALETTSAGTADWPAWVPLKGDPENGTPGVMAGTIAEYIGVHAYHDHVVAVWTDTRNGNQDVYSTQFTIPFLAPRLFLPVDGTVTPAGQPTFTWSTCWHEPQDSYRLEISSDSSFASLDYSFAGLIDNEFTPLTPLATGYYYWRVKGFRTAGDSTAFSDVFHLSPSCQPGDPPLLLEPLVSDTINVDSLAFVWAPVPGSLTHNFQLSEQPDFSVTVADTTVADTQITIAGLGDSLTYYWRVNTTSTCGTGDWNSAEVRVEVCPILATGDVNVDGSITSSDVIHTVNYVFKSGPPPLPVEAAGDVDCDGDVDSADIIALVNHIFKSGPAPCDACTVL